MLVNKTILLISPEPWGTNYVSKHHYAVTLAERGNKVFFLNPPSSGCNTKKVQKGLFILNYRSSYRGLARMPASLSAWLTAKMVRKLEDIVGCKFDVIWNFDSSRFFNLKRLRDKLRISHIVDLSEKLNTRMLGKTYDICFASTEFILTRQKKFNPLSYKINHGYAPAKYPVKYNLPGQNSQRTKAGYLGNLLIKYLDWDILYKLAKNNPEIGFYFAGPDNASNLSATGNQPAALTATRSLPNVCFTGALAHNQIASFLSQMDILLLAYRARDYYQQLANPHKILEYLASGRVVAATPVHEYRNKTDLMAMAEKDEDLPALFAEVADNLAHYNSPEKQQARQAWALENTYEKQVERIEKLLAKVLK